jgi:hypothetical protein
LSKIAEGVDRKHFTPDSVNEMTKFFRIVARLHREGLLYEPSRLELFGLVKQYGAALPRENPIPARFHPETAREAWENHRAAVARAIQTLKRR